VQLEEGFGVELLGVQAVRLLPHLPQLSHAALGRGGGGGGASGERPGDPRPAPVGTYRRVDLGVLPVFVLELLHPPLLPLPLLLVQALQVLAPLVLLQHLVVLELLVPLGVVVLQVLGGLHTHTHTDTRISMTFPMIFPYHFHNFNDFSMTIILNFP